MCFLLSRNRSGACAIGNSCRAGRPSKRRLYLRRPTRQPSRRDHPSSTRRDHDSDEPMSALPSFHPRPPNRSPYPVIQTGFISSLPPVFKAARVIDRQSCSLCCNHSPVPIATPPLCNKSSIYSPRKGPASDASDSALRAGTCGNSIDTTGNASEQVSTRATPSLNLGQSSSSRRWLLVLRPRTRVRSGPVFEMREPFVR